MADLEELFARLKAAGSAPPTSGGLPVQQTTPTLWGSGGGSGGSGGSSSSPKPNQSISAPLWSPPQTKVGLGAEQQHQQQRTSHLLGLLRFNSDHGVGGGHEHGKDKNSGGLGRSTSFTSSSATGGPTQSQGNWLADGMQQQKPGFLTTAGVEKPTKDGEGGNVGSAQADLLLNLLRKPTPTMNSMERQQPTTADQVDQSLAETTVNPLPHPKREGTPARQFGSAASRESTPFEAPPPAAKASKFTYTNPFDQLHASSPLNRGTPQPPSKEEGESGKHGREVRESDAGPAAKSRKVEDSLSSPSVNAEMLSKPNAKPESPAATTSVEPAAGKESVSEVLEGLGERVEKEVAEALDEAEKVAKNGWEGGTRKHGKEVTTDTEGAVKKEVADADSSWESAEESPPEKTGEFKVKVYNFPMKPFVAIDIKPDRVPDNSVRMEHVMSIAALKKDFEQMDRNLITASTSHIVYAQTATKKEHAGVRVIRQDTGEHAQVFRGSGERVFHVQLCSTPDADTVLGTGVRGSVYWTRLPRAGRLDAADAEAAGFILPAVPTAEEAAGPAATAVRTRAKCSTRHPGLVAMGRGRTIHLITPATATALPYCDPVTRRVDTARYLADHGLRITTGKAGKDFAFAEDDSVIVSLDKHGAVKFWDVRDLASRAANAASDKSHPPIELSRPLWTLHAAAATDKGASSVTSVMLLDKDRPHHKGQALRYLLLGFRQNHVLQLWDLGLAKPVQEVRLPHARDSDAICSLAYHPKTGILAVGHPTRNSVYFLHLSAPKYNLPAGMDQARFVSLLARADPALPRPESTAIVSGLREFALAPAGAGLRSLDMLRTPVEAGGPAGAADETLFELYVMHARGAFVWGVKRADLGWDGQGKMVEPVDALEAGVVQVSDLRVPQPKPASSAVGSEASSQATITAERKKENKKQDVTKQPGGSASKASGDTGAKRAQASSPAPVTNGAQRVDAKPEPSAKQNPEASTPLPHPLQQSPAINPPLITPNSYAMAAQRAKSPAKDSPTQSGTEGAAKKKAFTSATSTPAAAVSSSIESPNQSNDFPALLSRHLEALYQRLDSDKRVAAAASAAQQDAILRLVSSTLTENVERTLQRIVTESMTRDILPALTGRVDAQLDSAVRRELRDPNVLQRAVGEALRPEMEAHLQAAEAREGAKRDALADMLRTVSETLQNLVRAQTEMHERICALEVQVREMGTAAAAAAAAAHPKEGAVELAAAPTAEDWEVQQITNMLVNGDYEGATIQVCFPLPGYPIPVSSESRSIVY